MAAPRWCRSLAYRRVTQTDGQFLTFAHRSRLPTLDLLSQAAGTSGGVTQACRLCSQTLGDTPTVWTKARENDAALA